MKKVLLVLWLLLHTVYSFSQFQPMLIPVGEYAVDALSTIPSFCIDLYSRAPRSSDLYEHFTDNVFVTKLEGGVSTTKPANEVIGKWIKISGDNGEVNSLRIRKADPADNASYKFIVRNVNGVGGAAKSTLPGASLETGLRSYQASLNLIQDPVIRKLAKQDLIWNLQTGEPRSEILTSLTQARRANQLNLQPVNMVTDPVIKKYIKEIVYSYLAPEYTVTKINQSIQRMLRIRQLDLNAVNSITDQAIRNKIKDYVLTKLADEYYTVEEIRDFVSNASRITPEQIHIIENIVDAETQDAARGDLLYTLMEGGTLEEANEQLAKNVLKGDHRQKLNAFFKNDPLVLDELRYKGIDDGILVEMTDRQMLRLNAENKLTPASEENIKSVTEVHNKMRDYHVSDYYSTLSDDVRKFQKEHNLPVTGYPDDAFVRELNTYGKPYEVIKEYKKTGKPDKILAQSDNDFSSYYYSSYVVESDNQLYLIRYDQKSTILNSESVSVLEQDHLRKVSTNSNRNDPVVFMGIGSRVDNTGVIKIQVGEKVRQITWSDTRTYNELLADLEHDINLLPADTKLVLSQDLFQRGAFGSSAEPGQTVLNGKYVSDRTWINYTEFMRALQNKFPNRKFFLGGHFDKDIHTLSNVAPIRKAADVAALGSPDDVMYPQINEMGSKLRKSGITFHEVGDDLSKVHAKISESNIIMLSGHKDAAFEKYLRELADKGLLKDKIVAVFSCTERGTARLNSYLISKGAKKVIFFADRLKVDAINAVLNEVAELSAGINEIKGIFFEDLLLKAIDNAAAKYPELRADIDVLRALIIQTTFIQQAKNESNV